MRGVGWTENALRTGSTRGFGVSGWLSRRRLRCVGALEVARIRGRGGVPADLVAAAPVAAGRNDFSDWCQHLRSGPQEGERAGSMNPNQAQAGSTPVGDPTLRAPGSRLAIISWS